MWAAAPVTEEFKASEDRKTKPFQMSRYISTVICDVQERLLETGPAGSRVFPRGRRRSDINLRV
jgi:fructose-1,6-bisphosphatase